MKLVCGNRLFDQEANLITVNRKSPSSYLVNEKKVKITKPTIGLKRLDMFRTDRLTIVFHGRIYNIAELYQFSKSESNNTFCEIVNYCILSESLEKLLSVVDGIYSLYIYDRLKNRIKVITDRHGLHMTYYYHCNGIFCLSNSTTDILKTVPNQSLDQSAYSCFIELGYLMGQQTLFNDIKLTKPASILTYDIITDTLKQEYYWSWNNISRSTLSFDDAVDAVGNAFLESVQRRIKGDEKFGVSLSGGLDSRAIVAAVCKIDPHFSGYAYTFGIKNCLDNEIARKVARVANWEQEFFEINDRNWFYDRLPILFKTDGMADLKHLHGVEVGSEIQSKIEVNLNGYLGDVVAGGGWMNDNHLNERASDKNLSDFYNKFSSFGFHSDSYFDIENREPALYVSRARRFTNMGVTAGSIFVEQSLPFFDNNMLTTLLSLPDEYRLHNYLYSEMLKRFFPSFFLNIPWQKTGAIVKKFDKSRVNRNLFLRIQRRLRFLFQGKRVFYSDYPNWIRSPTFLDWAKINIPPSNTLTQVLYNAPNLSELLFKHVNGNLDFSDEILRILTLECYLTHLEAEGIRCQ